MEQDPVCGMQVDPRDAVESLHYHGRTYYFCSVGCAGKFSRAPQTYVKDDSEPSGTEERHAPPPCSGPMRDPVCGMQVDSCQYELDHAGIHYAFCSAQCRDRFLANPHLYVGVPGQKAPKQDGKAVMKLRRFRTETALAPEEAALLRRELGSMMGVTAVEVEADIVSVTYDLLQATASQLEQKMAEIGLDLGGSWTGKLRSAFVHYLEELEVDSLEVQPHLFHGTHGSHGHE